MPQPKTLEQIYAEVCRERDELLEEVRQLHALLRPLPIVPPTPEAWRLTPLELKLLGLLKSESGVVSRERAMAGLYGGAESAPASAIINVLVSKLRAKLAAQGLRDIIRTSWKRGWYVPAESWAQVDEKVREHGRAGS